MGYYDAVLHLDSSDEATFRLVLRNAENYLNALPDEEFSLEIIVNAGGATLLTNTRKDLAEAAQPVLARGVKLKICANAMAAHGLTKDEIWPTCISVPAGLVEIARLQKNGFSYIKP